MLVATFSLCLMPLLYFAAADRFRVEHNLEKVTIHGFFGDYLEDQAVSLSDLGFSTVLFEIILPSMLFFVLYIVAARVVRSFCESAERFFLYATNTDEQMMPTGNDLLIVRVALWPLFLIAGISLILGGLTVLLFKGIWR